MKDRKERVFIVRNVLSIIFVFAILPALVAAIIFSPSLYYAPLISLFSLVCIVPFVLGIENKTFGAKRLMPIAVMTAIAVAGRAAFFFLPQFKPIIAIVILCGVVFGKESGFLCGALSMLCSNFIFGQGPWTPMQMLSLGVIGYFSGLIRAGFRKNTVFLVIWGFLCGIAYGLFVDTYTVLSISSGIDFSYAVSLYLLGLPFNLVLALATAVFLALISAPIIKKTERVKQKLGLEEKKT